MEARLTLRRLLALAAIAAAAAVTSACGGGGDARAAAKEPALQSYSGSGFSFSYPAAWTAYPGKQAELHFQPLVYLSTQPVHDPCSTKGSETTCGFPVDRLKPGGVLVVWLKYGVPAMSLGSGGRIHVGGDPATYVDKPGGECRKIGADRTIQAAVQTSPPPAAFTYLTACLREPGAAENARSIKALLASTKFLSD
jgi:hypothetical protein